MPSVASPKNVRKSTSSREGGNVRKVVGGSLASSCMVLMADGSTKRAADIGCGDRVASPRSPSKEARVVLKWTVPAGLRRGVVRLNESLLVSEHRPVFVDGKLLKAGDFRKSVVHRSITLHDLVLSSGHTIIVDGIEVCCSGGREDHPCWEQRLMEDYLMCEVVSDLVVASGSPHVVARSLGGPDSRMIQDAFPKRDTDAPTRPKCPKPALLFGMTPRQAQFLAQIAPPSDSCLPSRALRRSKRPPPIVLSPPPMKSSPPADKYSACLPRFHCGEDSRKCTTEAASDLGDSPRLSVVPEGKLDTKRMGR